jgi:ribosomal protein S18 acetylase RimI-like enzyme
MSDDKRPVPRSLVWATQLDVLPQNLVVEQRPGFLLVRSPSNPEHYWGNLLLFDRAPRAGDGLRWETLFDETFADEPRVRHRCFAWDRTDGALGAATEEFGTRGYKVETSVGLCAGAAHLVMHPRANHEVVVRPLDPAIGSDTALWDAVIELQVAGRDDPEADEDGYRSFSRTRLEGLRALFRAGRGAWYVAIDPASSEVAASCGVVVTAGRGRFQIVDTALAHRRRGICSRLVVEAARRALDDYGAERLVIVADAGYHALGLYRSLGFQPTETVSGACLASRADSVFSATNAIL